MRRLLLATLLLTSAVALADEADPDGIAVPADARRTVLDLVYRVVDTAGSAISTVENDSEIRMALAADVLFDFDKADIKAEAEPILGQLAEALRARSPKKVVRIEGHTDAKGAAAYNLTLSQKRAAAVKAWLAKQTGLGKLHWEIKGWGATKPAVPNAKPDGSDDPDGRAKNRRVELVIAK